MKIKLTASIRHDGKNHDVGDVLNIADVAAQRLIKLGVAKQLGKPAPNADKKDKGNPSGNKKGDSNPPDDNPDDDESMSGFDIDAATVDEIAQELTILGVGYKGDETREQLAALLKETLTKKE